MSLNDLSFEECSNKVTQLKKGWKLHEGFLEKTFYFKNFPEALAFVNKIGDLAENANHHPDIRLTYNQVKIELCTHDVKAITNKDFLLAARIDKIEEKRS